MRLTDDDSLITLRLLLDDLISDYDVRSVLSRYKELLFLKRRSIITHATRARAKKGIDYHNLVLDRIIKIRSMTRQEFNLSSEGEPAFLVRVDDFPNPAVETERFLAFHKKLLEKDIPYLLGVTPLRTRAMLAANTADFGIIEEHELEILKKASVRGVDIAMHGITHQTRNAHRPTEIAGLSLEDLEKKLLQGLEKLRTDGYKVDAFIPPFNSFDLPSIKVLRKYFKVICGGPESVLRVGLRLSPSFLNNVLYVPSYCPAYGRANELLGFVQNLRGVKEHVYVPLTLHWNWEARNNFADVEKLCTAIQGRVVPWGNILRHAEAILSSESGN